MWKKAFTLVEIMIVVAIIGIIAAIAIPTVEVIIEEVRQRICRENLRAIDNTKVRWATDNSEEDEDAEPTVAELAEYVQGDLPQPIIAGALYKIGSIATPAMCSYHGSSWLASFDFDPPRITFPEDIVDLVDDEEIITADILDGDWRWHSNPDGKSRFYTLCLDPDPMYSQQEEINYYGYATVESFEIDCSTPEITINGVTIKGDTITHMSKDYIEKNRGYMEAYGPKDPEYYVVHKLKMLEGGYEVRKMNVASTESGGTVNRCEYYDHRGELIASIEGEHVIW